MKLIKYCAALLALAALSSALWPAQAIAQDTPKSVSADDPKGMEAVLKLAGYEPTLERDNIGDPLIQVKFGDWEGKILFFGCDTDTNRDCESIMLSTGFDRDQPMPPGLVNEIMRTKRFASVRLDDEGDPFIEWDMVLSEPVPTSLFLRSVRLYSASLDDVAALIFAEERSDDDGGDNARVNEA
jgi:hypothetical protein